MDFIKSNTVRRALQAVAVIIALAAALMLTGFIAIKNATPTWDAGACWSGYVTHIFQKYDDVLVDMYRGESYSAAQAVLGTQSGDDAGNQLLLEFDIQLISPTGEITTQRASFIGTRTWIDTYSWCVA